MGIELPDADSYEFGRDAMASPGQQPTVSCAFMKAVVDENVTIEIKMHVVQTTDNMNK